ncbi:MAG: ferritin-like domain-containing protein [Alphaproteobacteria bacterium]|nr:ferritin-like domain-containing protein [Alphaproteobacteria bacterium]
MQGTIADEHSASSLYSQIIDSTDNEEVKNVLTEIMNDEIQHIWRLTDLVLVIDKNWETQLKAAEKEGEDE